jgi:hypothetical protein
MHDRVPPLQKASRTRRSEWRSWRLRNEVEYGKGATTWQIEAACWARLCRSRCPRVRPKPQPVVHPAVRPTHEASSLSSRPHPDLAIKNFAQSALQPPHNGGRSARIPRYNGGISRRATHSHPQTLSSVQEHLLVPWIHTLWEGGHRPSQTQF